MKTEPFENEKTKWLGHMEKSLHVHFGNETMLYLQENWQGIF